MDMAGIISNALWEWTGVIVLSLIPINNVGAGRNFGMTIELSAGLVGMIFALNARLTSWTGFYSHIGGNGGRACIWPNLCGGFKQTEAERDCGETLPAILLFLL